MEEIVLSRAEFLVLLDVAGVSTVVGLPVRELIPASRENHRELVRQGHAILEQRGLLEVRQDGILVLDPRLVAIAATIARPHFAFISVRSTPRLGRQLALHYVSQEQVVEQTLPVEGQHRVALLNDLATLYERLGVFFPLEAGPAPEAGYELSEEEFLRGKELAEQSGVGPATATFAALGLSAADAESLAVALAEPAFGGTIAILKCRGDEIVDARNPALANGKSGAWTFIQTIPGVSRFSLTRADVTRLRSQLAAWLTSMEG